MFDFHSTADLLKKAPLDEILADLLSQIKVKPDDIYLRELLFKLYCVDGFWEKALLQLEIIHLMDDSFKKRSELYKNLVFSEILRERVLSGEGIAGTLDDAFPEWVGTLQKANKFYGEGDIKNAEILRSEAFGQAPESVGNSTTAGDFLWISDSDGRIGPTCEFISAGGYRWVPFSMMTSFEVPKPKDLLDLVWAPAHLKIKDDIYYGFIPARYPLVAETDVNIKLGLRTEWTQISESLSIAKGRKTLITDQGEFSLLELDQVTFF